MGLNSGLGRPIVYSPSSEAPGDFQTWTLSSITDIPDDASAGDYGALNGRVYRLTELLALPGGGTRAMWVDPRVHAGTVAVSAYLDGDEVVSNDTALNAQGWPTVIRTNGAITSQTTRVRLATSAASGAVAISALTSGVSPTTRVYARMLWRSAIGNASGNNSTTAIPFEFADGAAYFTPVYHSLAVSKGTYFWTGVSTDTSGSVLPSQAAVPNLSGTDDLFEIVYNGTAGIAQMYRNGALVASAVGLASVAADRLQIRSLSGSTASQTASQEVSEVMVLTW